MVKKEGVLRPMRGIGAVVLGAGPAHALYFSSYEYFRDVIAQNSILNTTLSSGELFRRIGAYADVDLFINVVRDSGT